jgi:hypothetical protein
MTSPPKSTALVASAFSGAARADRFVRRGVEPRHPQPGDSSEATTFNRADRPLVVSAKRPPRILVVDAALALDGLHVELLRSIPAIVKSLASCADMYLHKEHAYALVILKLDPQARETAEATHFVRGRWSASRILLVESESAAIDDWIYDERLDPHLHPATVRETVIRPITEGEYWIPA